MTRRICSASTRTSHRAGRWTGDTGARTARTRCISPPRVPPRLRSSMTNVLVKHERAAIVPMYAGLALTVVAMIIPYIDHATANVLADHIRAGYPTYSQARIDTAATTYLIYVSIIGALGVICWFWTIRAVNAGKRWARGAATAMLVLATGTALVDLLVTDTS